MKKNHWAARLLALMLVSFALLTATVMATGTAGTQDDPLVTLSYLNDTFLGQILGGVDAKIDAHDQALAEKLDAAMADDLKALDAHVAPGDPAETFTVVTLSNGQVLHGEIGCEVMLRVGTASVVSSTSPGLIDETDASTLDNGKALVKNHLYMMTISERGVKATAATTKLLVRGGYTVK